MLRMRQARKKTGRSAEPRVFGLVSTSPTIDLKQRARVLATELQQMGLRVAIVGEVAVACRRVFRRAGNAQRDPSCCARTWATRRGSGDDPAPFGIASGCWRDPMRGLSIPLMPEETSPARQFRLVDLVLLHHATPHDTTRTLEWKYAADAARVLHWTGMDDEDCRRLASNT